MERTIPKENEIKLMRVLSGEKCPDEKCEGTLTISIPYGEGLIMSCNKCKTRVNLNNVKIIYDNK